MVGICIVPFNTAYQTIQCWINQLFLCMLRKFSTLLGGVGEIQFTPFLCCFATV